VKPVDVAALNALLAQRAVPGPAPVSIPS